MEILPETVILQSQIPETFESIKWSRFLDLPHPTSRALQSNQSSPGPNRLERAVPGMMDGWMDSPHRNHTVPTRTGISTCQGAVRECKILGWYFSQMGVSSCMYLMLPMMNAVARKREIERLVDHS